MALPPEATPHGREAVDGYKLSLRWRAASPEYGTARLTARAARSVVSDLARPIPIPAPPAPTPTPATPYAPPLRRPERNRPQRQTLGRRRPIHPVDEE